MTDSVQIVYVFVHLSTTLHVYGHISGVKTVVQVLCRIVSVLVKPGGDFHTGCQNGTHDQQQSFSKLEQPDTQPARNIEILFCPSRTGADDTGPIVRNWKIDLASAEFKHSHIFQ